MATGRSAHLLGDGKEKKQGTEKPVGQNTSLRIRGKRRDCRKAKREKQELRHTMVQDGLAVRTAQKGEDVGRLQS